MEVDSKTMHRMHRIAGMRVAILRREGKNCCKTEASGALRRQKECPLLPTAERLPAHRRSLLDGSLLPSPCLERDLCAGFAVELSVVEQS